MTTGTLIRQARLQARLSQAELALRTGRERTHIARWERDVVEPSFSTLREILRACGYDISTALVPYDPAPLEALAPLQALTPAERLDRMLTRAEHEESS